MPNSFLPEEPFVEQSNMVGECLWDMNVDSRKKGILHQNASCWFTFWEFSTILNVKPGTTHLVGNSYPSFTHHIKKYIYCGFHTPWWSSITYNACFPLSDKTLHKFFCSLPWFLSHHIDPCVLPTMSSSTSCSSFSSTYLRLFCFSFYIQLFYWPYACAYL